MLDPRPVFLGQVKEGRHGASTGAPGVTATTRDDLILATVMARKGQEDALAAKVQAAFGIALPMQPKRVAAGSIAFIGSGPGQWIATEDGGDSHSFAARLSEKFSGSASVSDQSDARAVIRIAGPRARDTLAKGLAVDLHPSVFKPGDAALSSISLIGAHLWQLDDVPTYEIAVFRSMAGSFAHWLEDSAAEFGYEIVLKPAGA